ncbi:hypothetical protein pEaSNUABM19_00001 [Erwinia phage pEa_SNUABM_19]|nr:hypothetical protein pEaSNUABM19_00001 [Erwinia phage pEa_SNUABM_19]
MVPMRYMGACTRIKERNPITELFLKRWHKVLAKVYRYDNIYLVNTTPLFNNLLDNYLIVILLFRNKEKEKQKST